MRNARENCSSIKSPKIEIELKLKNSIDCFIIKNVKYIEKKDKKNERILVSSQQRSFRIDARDSTCIK